MNDRAQRALARGHRGEEAAAAQALEQEVYLDVPAQDWDDILKKQEDIPARVPRAIGRAPAAFPAAIDPRMWLNMVNDMTPYLAVLELESMKSLFWIMKGIARSDPNNCCVGCSNLS